LGVFPREQLYIGFFDDIKNRPRQLLDELFGFLGVSRKVRWDAFPCEEVVYGGLGISMPEKMRSFLENMYAEQIEDLYCSFGEKVETWRVKQRADDAV